MVTKVLIVLILLTQWWHRSCHATCWPEPSGVHMMWRNMGFIHCPSNWWSTATSWSTVATLNTSNPKCPHIYKYCVFAQCKDSTSTPLVTFVLVNVDAGLLMENRARQDMMDSLNNQLFCEYFFPHKSFFFVWSINSWKEKHSHSDSMIFDAPLLLRLRVSVLSFTPEPNRLIRGVIIQQMLTPW